MTNVWLAVGISLDAGMVLKKRLYVNQTFEMYIRHFN